MFGVSFIYLFCAVNIAGYYIHIWVQNFCDINQSKSASFCEALAFASDSYEALEH